ncbi:MAG: cupin domain-containing protein [Candidatus Bathyarchaeota archaeon]|nr:cupin domain-containing protein [Candidatus Bathyarchaeota archaeon]
MIVKKLREIEGKIITQLEHKGKKVDVGEVQMKWLSYQNLGNYKHDFIVRHVAYEPGTKVPMHEHEYAHSLYILKGRFEITSGGETREVGQDTFIDIPPFESHEAKNLGDEQAALLCCINCVGNGDNCIPK